MTNERILVIDSSEEEREFIVERALKPHGYRALVAFDHETGLEAALTQHPDLILLALSLSDRAGLDLLDALREEGATTPVVLMTPQTLESAPIRLLNQGVKAYVPKPVQVPNLLTAIETALIEGRLRREQENLTERLSQAGDQVERRLKELNTLFGVGKSIVALSNQSQLFSRLVEAAIYLTGAEESSLLLIDNETGELYVEAAQGMDDRLARSLRFRVEDSLAGKVMTGGQSITLNKTDTTAFTPDYPAFSLIYAPLQIRGQVKGVLGVSNRRQERDFTNHDIRLLSALSDYAAIFLDNVSLAHQVDSEQTKLRSVLDAIEQPIAIINDADNKVILTNLTFRRTFDLSEEALAERTAAELLPHQPLIDFIATTPPVDNQSEIFLGDDRVFSATLAPIPGGKRAILMQDITHFKTLNELKSDFIVTIAQTLQTPLISIREYAGMLQAAGSLTEKQTLFFERITSSLEKIINLVYNLLDLSSIEIGSDLSLSVFDLGQIAAEAAAEFQKQARHKGQQLVYHAPPAPAFVVGAPLRLRQVIGHLIDNAVKYTAKDGRISIIIHCDDEQLFFKIEDNGLGIPPADQPFIFDKFFRVEAENQANIPGVGLGLAVCKAVIEKYGGAIWVESVYGQGSAFFFTLPLALPEMIDKANSSINTEAMFT